MAITYTFIPTKVDIAPSLDGLEKIITRVRYDYKGVNEDGIEGVFAGVTLMPEPKGSESFKPFEDLQPEDIISWLEEVADKTHMEQRIEKQISDQIVPKYVETNLPWEPIKETPIFNQISTTTQI